LHFSYDKRLKLLLRKVLEQGTLFQELFDIGNYYLNSFTKHLIELLNLSPIYQSRFSNLVFANASQQFICFVENLETMP
jgi:hypothetical protein